MCYNFSILLRMKTLYMTVNACALPYVGRLLGALPQLCELDLSFFCTLDNSIYYLLNNPTFVSRMTLFKLSALLDTEPLPPALTPEWNNLTHLHMLVAYKDDHSNAVSATLVQMAEKAENLQSLHLILTNNDGLKPLLEAKHKTLQSLHLHKLYLGEEVFDSIVVKCSSLQDLKFDASLLNSNALMRLTSLDRLKQLVVQHIDEDLNIGLVKRLMFTSQSFTLGFRREVIIFRSQVTLTITSCISVGSKMEQLLSHPRLENITKLQLDHVHTDEFCLVERFHQLKELYLGLSSVQFTPQNIHWALELANHKNIDLTLVCCCDPALVSSSPGCCIRMNASGSRNRLHIRVPKSSTHFPHLTAILKSVGSIPKCHVSFTSKDAVIGRSVVEALLSMPHVLILHLIVSRVTLLALKLLVVPGNFGVLINLQIRMPNFHLNLVGGYDLNIVVEDATVDVRLVTRTLQHLRLSAISKVSLVNHCPTLERAILWHCSRLDELEQLDIR